MSVLLIVGNGFDLFHKLKTSYKDFEGYLREKYNLDSETYYGIVALSISEIDRHGTETYEPQDLAKLFTTTINEIDTSSRRRVVTKHKHIRNIKHRSKIKFSEVTDGYYPWSNLEYSLGKLTYCSFLDEVRELSGSDEYSEAGNMNHYSEMLFNAFNQAKVTLFRDWISDVERNLGKCIEKKSIKKIIKNCDHILNFNYTNTIENLYHRNNVFHIHGECSSSTDDLILGHGNTEYDQRMFSSDRYFGSEYFVSKLYYKLMKDTTSIIGSNIRYFDNLNTLTYVYSIGFSYSTVDMPYIRKIVERTNKSTKWICFYHNQQDVNVAKKLLRSINYHGEFSFKSTNLL